MFIINSYIKDLKVYSVDLFSDIVEVQNVISEYKKKHIMKTYKITSDIDANAKIYNMIKKLNKNNYVEQELLIHCLNLINLYSCDYYFTNCNDLLIESIVCKKCLDNFLFLVPKNKSLCNQCQKLIDEFYSKENSKCIICTMKIIIKINHYLFYERNNSGYKFSRKFIKFILSVLEYKLKDLDDEFYISFIRKLRKEKQKRVLPENEKLKVQ